MKFIEALRADEKEVEKWWKKKVLPFLPDDEVKWADLRYLEKLEIKLLFVGRENG